MTHHRTVTLALALVAVGNLSAAGPIPLAADETNHRSPTTTRGESGQTLTWTQGTGGGTWQEATLQAANHVEGGFTDWRLPTVDELQTAVTDSDPATFGQYDPNVNFASFWTSKSQGNWSYVINVVTDANGYPIPSQSGAGKKEPKNGLHPAKFVRP